MEPTEAGDLDLRSFSGESDVDLAGAYKQARDWFVAWRTTASAEVVVATDLTSLYADGRYQVIIAVWLARAGEPQPRFLHRQERSTPRPYPLRRDET